MARIINNQFTREDDGVRGLRLLLMQANIDTYAVELSVAGDLLTWAQDSYDNWLNFVETAAVEGGQVVEAFQEFHQKIDETRDYYINAKDILKAVLDQYEKDDEIVKAYCIAGRVPIEYMRFIYVIGEFKKEHVILTDLGDPRVVSQAIVDQMMILRDEMEALRITAELEGKESSAAYRLKKEALDLGTVNLKLIYTISKMVWGNDHENLRLLGFCPKSEIWTEEKPYAPNNFAFDDVAKRFNWDIVMDVDSYEVDYRLTGASGDWTTLYEGAENFTNKKPPDPGEYDFRVRAIADGDLGAWSGVIVVNFLDGALAAPTGFKFDDTNQLFLWKIVPDADSYQLEYSRDGGQSWTIKYDGADAKFDALHMDSGKWLFRVRALNATEISPWGITLEVWLGVPNVPGNMRWHPEEYHGDMFAKIEWDAAAGATEYQLDYINDGESFNTGSNTFKYEDIIGLPREHEYKVRAGNAYGWSEFSPVFVIVLA